MRRTTLTPLLWVLAFSACRREPLDPCAPRPGEPPPPGLGIAVSPASLFLTIGERGTLTANVPYNPACPHPSLTVGWRSSNAAIAQVEADTGNTTTVLGVAEGTASIIATVIADPTRATAAVAIVSGPKQARGQVTRRD